MTPVGRRLTRRARFWAGFRCKEPVVVLESDDWGLRRRPAADQLSAYGTPSEWADEQAEGPDDVSRLLEVLERHRGPDGRPAAMTMNVVAANPDLEAIAADGFERYHDRPVDETLDPTTLAALREGVHRSLLALELHGRSHLAVDRWLADLRADERAATLLRDGVDGGLSLLEGEGHRYQSEYLDWATGHARTEDDLVAWLRPAVDTVTRLAGTAPRATVAPHYVLTDAAERAVAHLGIEYVQATDYRLHPRQERPRASYLGQPRPTGVVHLTRTVRFDPRPQRRGHHVAEAVAGLRRCFGQGLPAVVDTHRINYTGRWGAAAAAELDGLLAAADAAGARYRTTAELGDAVTGRTDDLTPVGRTARAVVRPVMR